MKQKKSYMLLIISSTLALLIFSLFVFLLIVSPGKPKPVTDFNGKPVEGSFSEKVYLTIGGVRQGMFIRGKDPSNPVLLYVHGGPSFSEFFLIEKYPSGIENYFTVCYWEQRGGGLSFSPQLSKESLTLDQLASDAIEVTNYLRGRFKKEKIFVMAHSGGTAFAIQAVAKYPDLFHAYIGVSQITRQAESEKLAYKYMTDKFSAAGNSRMVNEFKKYPVLEDDCFLLPFFNSVLRDKSMHELGIGTMRNMKSIIKGVFYPVWTCRAYTLREKFNIWRSKLFFINKSRLRKQILESDIPSIVTRLEIPVYFISGRHDLTVNHDLSEDYLLKLDAPKKRFFTFENSAHSPMYEEPEKFLELLTRDILQEN
ncbi:MAG: alpha/beta hydrolase [Bacteroidales bacterium]|nr:alpha/beta hydrolase [Bacteroidales bacterium]